MAKLTKQKSRKEYICQKCKHTIHVGEEYYKIEAMYAATKYRCLNCKPSRSELTSSEYLAWLYELKDNIDHYDLRTEEGKDDLYTEIEQMKSELEDKLYNMPEQLQYAPTGEMIQERIDALDEALSDLDSVDFPDEEDYKVTDEDVEFEDEREQTEEAKKEEYDEAIDDFEQACRDAVDNIPEE